MNGFFHITRSTLCLLAFSVLAHAAPPPIGALTRLKLQGTEHGYILVSIPKAAEARKTLPVLFWFHGTGGKPTAQFGYLAGSTQSHASIFRTGPRYQIDETYRTKTQAIADGFIVVGMSYPERPEGAPRFPAMRIWELCRKVRDQLHKTYPIDYQRCYLGGFSRGGNNAFRIAIEPPHDLAGIAMFAGGVPAGYKFDPQPKFNRRFRVLICNGELDSNFWAAHIARRFFLARGAEITYDEWPGGEHTTFVPSRRVVDWFDEVLDPSDKTEELITEYKAISAPANSWQHYMALRNLLGDPRIYRSDTRFRQRIQNEMQSLLNTAEVADFKRSLDTVHAVVKTEINLFHFGHVTSDSLEALEQRYHTLARRLPSNAPCIRNALQGTRRVGIYRREEMYNRVPIDEPTDPNAGMRNQLEQHIAQLQDTLKDAQFESNNRQVFRPEDRNERRGIERQIQQLKTQLARIPRFRPPPEAERLVPQADFEKLSPAEVEQRLGAIPLTPTLPKSSPAH